MRKTRRANRTTNIRGKIEKRGTQKTIEKLSNRVRTSANKPERLGIKTITNNPATRSSSAVFRWQESYSTARETAPEWTVRCEYAAISESTRQVVDTRLRYRFPQILDREYTIRVIRSPFIESWIRDFNTAFCNSPCRGYVTGIDCCTYRVVNMRLDPDRRIPSTRHRLRFPSVSTSWIRPRPAPS